MIRVYIASPYSHADAGMRLHRANAALAYAAWLWQIRAMHPFSPIAHWHHGVEPLGLPSHADPWISYNRRELRISEALHVLCIPGWQESQGVAWEIGWARDWGKPITLATPSAANGYDLIPLDAAHDIAQKLVASPGATG